MGTFVPHTPEEQRAMLQAIGLDSFDGLYADVPAGVRLTDLPLPSGMSELEARRTMEEMAAENFRFRHIFRGAGAYCHYIPSVVKQIASKEEFVTAYTPYQAEISQGVLQSIFEYQTMICDLTGMDVSNASVYDGCTAAAEAAAMCRDRKRGVVLVSAAAHPYARKTIGTYCFGSGAEVVTVPEKDGRTDLEALKELLNDQSACFYFQQPSFFGCIEDADAICALVHEAGAKLIMGSYPMALALLKTPGEVGADVAVGEGQPLGLSVAFGGPYLGFMAAGGALTRKLPGRIVGQTVDDQGRRAFVLTLQAREQHIRREKAGSNICSNEALCALTATAYLAAMGPEGFREAARQSVAKAHYLEKKLSDAGLKRIHSGEFFNEFVTSTPVPAADILAALEDRDYLGGLPLGKNEILWCATEKNTAAEIDELAEIVKEVTGA
ncbi:MAG: aminomethyl-transferring glycine dehydrogenase subunit GcvPA [Oscillospiraceae bacterium]|nr:aminomethyl-transferring glycine dehydrogenase subunit GcvPA [Oscillospiraceae bacterium]